jgi:hypothetical protein
MPARVRGLLAAVREKAKQLDRNLNRLRGDLTQQCISSHSFRTTYFDAKLRELYSQCEADLSASREEWFCKLSPADQKAIDNYCLEISGPTLASLFPLDLPTPLHGSLARLALQNAALERRYACQRQETVKSLAERGLRNQTIVDSLLLGLANDENEAKSRLLCQWLRELNAEQAAVFDGRPDTNVVRLPPTDGAARPVGDKPSPLPVAIDGERLLVNGKPMRLDVTDDVLGDIRHFLGQLIQKGGQWITGPEIARANSSRYGDRYRWDRLIARLPSRLKKHIETKRKLGYRIRVAD